MFGTKKTGGLLSVIMVMMMMMTSSSFAQDPSATTVTTDDPTTTVVTQAAPVQPPPAPPAPPPPPAAPPLADTKNRDMPKPLNSLQGSYKLTNMRTADHPPTLATIWDLAGVDFDIVVWPPKECAAVHVYFIDAKFKGAVLHIVEDIAKRSPFVKFYPQIGKIDVKPTQDGNVLEGTYNQRHAISFTHLNSSKYSVELSNNFVDKINKYNGIKTKQSVQMELSGRLAFVVTNSRFCFAHVTRDRQNTFYTSLFDFESFSGNQNGMPKYLSTFDQPEGVHSLFKPPVNLEKNLLKSVDLLSVLKPPVFQDMSKMRPQLKVCSGYRTRSRNPLKKAFGLITVDSWKVSEENAQLPKRYSSFYVDIGERCSWIRLWITNTEKFDSYNDNMKLDETIDFFFDQQFYVGPDSDEARPLTGHSGQINRLSIRRHWFGDDHKHTDDAVRAVQLSYGRDQGPALPYIEFFNLKSMAQNNFYVHLIKAANCEANITPASQTSRLASANPSEPNSLQFTECTRTILQNKYAGPIKTG